MSRNINAGIVRHGFTMIELLVVVAILAIAAAIVVPMASSAGSMQLRAAVNMVAADLEYAKSMSISRGQRYAVIFDKTAGIYYRYRVVDQSENPVPHPITKRPEYVVTLCNPDDRRLDQVQIASVDFDGMDKVGFESLGSPFNGGGAGLNKGEVTLQAGGITKIVKVEAVTGYISVVSN